MDRIYTNADDFGIDDLNEGGVFLVDKPQHWTSFDVVNKLRYSIRHVLGRKKYKIGHAGTLDPLATGLLIICFSKYTKKIELLTKKDKRYTGSFKLWATTPCYDAELPVDVYYPNKRYDQDQLLAVAQSLSGEIDQIPPLYSAIKKNGVPLYRLARRGDKTEIKSRRIIIKSLSIDADDYPNIAFDVSCSKGTYIRSLAYDFGLRLGNGAYLSSLRRIAVGDYSVDDSWHLQDLVDQISILEKSL